jgi:hypothetical protein
MPKGFMCGTNTCLLKFLLFCSLFINIARAQGLSNDPQKNSLDLSYPVRLYYHAIGENAHIYNGYEYMTPDRNTRGTPYFSSDAPYPANILYDDSYYQNLPILYDQVRDLVVINRLDQNFKISLISQKMVSFSFHGHDFIRITRDSSRGVELTTGFYDRVYAGKSTVLVRRKKYVQDMVEYTITILSYKEQYSYYVKFEGKYTEVNNKSSVLNLFKSKKSEIKSYLRKNKLKFKTDFEKTLIATSAYYDQLTS